MVYVPVLYLNPSNESPEAKWTDVAADNVNPDPFVIEAPDPNEARSVDWTSASFTYNLNTPKFPLAKELAGYEYAWAVTLLASVPVIVVVALNIPFITTLSDPSVIVSEVPTVEFKLFVGTLVYPEIACVESNDNFPETPVFDIDMVERSGAGGGARALRTSLKRSTAVPTGVVVVKSVKSPSVYVPSSASPIRMFPLRSEGE
jgi:hypothetical protein